MSEKQEYLFKVTLVGDGAVGKTTLLKRYVEGRFEMNYLMTIGADFMVKIVNMKLYF